MKIEKKWQLADPITPEAAAALSAYAAPIQQILFNRGVTTAAQAHAFFHPAPPADADPFRLSGMDTAVDRIESALQAGETIAIYGDYDADGVTATALMMQTFTALEADVQAYIPNRFDEGYGLNNDALDELKSRGVDLVITVDCGIRALAEAEYAREIGMDLIITDHHNPGEELPDALAVVNPKKPGDEYPAKMLAGVGVAYKLACALAQRAEDSGFDPETVLDLVAIGTVADLVSLEGENRYLVRAGLERLKRPQRQGLFSLMQLTGVRPSQVRASTIGFSLGPRLNAAGRLESALDAYELLITGDLMEAGRLAQQLDNQNRKRQKITREMQELSEQIAIADGQVPYLLFAAHESFNPGVVGLAASRLTDRFYRPAIVGHADVDTVRASCRSIPEFDITAALDRCSDLLLHYGGHAAAAGFTVSNDRLEELLDRLSADAAKQLQDEDLRPVILSDYELPFSFLTMDFLEELEKLQPTGYGNREPVFLSRNLQVVRSRTVGRDSSHLKLTLSDGRKKVDAIAFRQGHWQANMPEKVDVVYHFEKNEYQGNITPQLNVRDLKPSE